MTGVDCLRGNGANGCAEPLPARSAGAPVPLTYLLPIRLAQPPDPELTSYLRRISEWCPLVIVDGSPAEVFSAADLAWSAFSTHVAPDPSLRCINGKVHGVLTGLRLVATDAVVIADDDVRYSRTNLADLAAALDQADLVVPQNYFHPVPWHARWDTARTLLNRISGGDFPGTMGVRMPLLRATDGYDGNVLFENLELIRTIEAVGGRVWRRPAMYVRRVPPSTRHFVGQRVRQAYDELARPVRLLTWLAVLPVIVTLGRRPSGAVAAVAIPIAAAEAGRRRAGGTAYFPPSSSLLAPAWVLERAVCVWLATATRLRGGVRYSGGRIVRAANSRATLRRRHATGCAS